MKITKSKILLRFGFFAGIFLVLSAIGFGLLSRYINSEAAQNNIRRVVTRQTGNSVKYQRAYLSVFPRPCLAFDKVVAVIPHAAAIRAQSASIYPVLLPLLTGRVRLAKLKLEAPEIIIDIPEKAGKEEQDKTSFGQAVADIDAVIASIREAVPGLVCELQRGKLLVREAGQNTITAQDVNTRVALVPGGVEIRFSGDVSRFGNVSARGKFYREGSSILIKNLSASLLDSSFAASAVISWSDQAIDSANVAMSGNLGPDTVLLVSKMFNLPPEHTLRAPLTISNAHLVWQEGSNLAVSGVAAIRNGPTFSLDLRKYADVLDIKQLIVRDEDSHAAIGLTYGKKQIDFSFVGSITEKALNRAFERSAFHHGWMKGSFRAHIRLDKPEGSSARGNLEGAHLIVALGKNKPLRISRFSLSTERKTVKVNAAALSFGDNQFVLKGSVKPAGSGFRFDMDASSDGVVVEKIRQALADDMNPAAPAPDKLPGKKSKRNSMLQGVVRFKAGSVTWGRYTTSPVAANIVFDQKGVSAAVTEAALCGVLLPGNLRFYEKHIGFDFKPEVTAGQLSPALDCLLGAESQITGVVDLKAELSSGGEADALVRALQGKVDIRAKDGRIYRFPLLSKILSFLNVTELLRGKMPDFDADGLGYNSIIIKGDIRNGIFTLSEAVIDGTTMQIVCQGDIDLARNRINLTVLVAPFKTVDYVVSKLPLVSYVLKGTLVSIPLRITGRPDDPRIIILSPTAVSKGVMGIMKRTLLLPVKIIEPVIPGKLKEQ